MRLLMSTGICECPSTRFEGGRGQVIGPADPSPGRGWNPSQVGDFRADICEDRSTGTTKEASLLYTFGTRTTALPAWS